MGFHDLRAYSCHETMELWINEKDWKNLECFMILLEMLLKS